VTGLPIRLLGAVSALIGVALVVWVVYNIFVERQAAFTGIHSVFQLAIPLLLIAVGLRWARNPLGPSKGMWSSLWG
jgi:hypothetical protein